jgi:hypothetical protein
LFFLMVLVLFVFAVLGIMSRALCKICKLFTTGVTFTVLWMFLFQLLLTMQSSKIFSKAFSALIEMTLWGFFFSILY